MHNEAGRACVLIVKLNYKGQKRDFVVPLKSNITPNTDKHTFFPLPPNSRTNPEFLTGVMNIIENNEHIIIKACQEYLDEYVLGNSNAYTPDIDAIIKILDEEDNNEVSKAAFVRKTRIIWIMLGKFKKHIT